MMSSLWIRGLAGSAFVLLVTGLAYLGGVAFLFLALAIVVGGLAEYFRLARASGYSPSGVLGTALGAGVVICAYLWGAAGSGVAASAATGVCLLAPWVWRPANGHRGAAATAIGVLYVAFLGSHMVILRESPGAAGLDYGLGFVAVMLAFVATWCCDTAAYLVGSSFGVHKLAPSISPKKTWEGAVAGVFGAIGGVALVNAIGNSGGGPAEVAGLGISVAVMAQLGDLLESKIKRGAGYKDSSGIIPGHGGVLDRFDGFLFAAPMVYYFLAAGGFGALG